MSFNAIDILLALLVALSVFYGWHRGFIAGGLDLLRWTSSLLAGLFFYQPAARWLGLLTDWTEVWIEPAAFLLVFVVVSLSIGLSGSWLLRRVPKAVHRQRVNRFFGVLPGLANGLIVAAIAAALLFAAPLSNQVSDSAQESFLANRLAVFAEKLESALNPIFNRAITQTLTRVTSETESTKSVELPFRIQNSRPRPDLEAQMLELVNRERVAAGLEPLVADPEATEVARRHSADMLARGYFSHQTPENASPFDRMRAGGVRFLTAGENLALAPTLQTAHTGLMNSPGHRANILRPQFGRVGIGVMDSGRRGLMITQNFRN